MKRSTFFKTLASLAAFLPFRSVAETPDYKVPANTGTRHGDQVEMPVSAFGSTYMAKIDRGVADLVAALQRAGINTTSSCDGHGQHAGYIKLQDGRTLFITDERKWTDYTTDMWGRKDLLITEGKTVQGQ